MAVFAAAYASWAKDNGAGFGTLMQRSLAGLRTAAAAQDADDSEGGPA